MRTMELLWDCMRRLGYFFYIMDPREHMYQEMDDVKDYYIETIPVLAVTFITEHIVRYFQKKPLFRMNDTGSSICIGALVELSKIPFKGAEVFVFAWIYKHYRIWELPWDSVWTWIACLILTDLAYYWMHRMSHQMNIFWAIHETHHSSEDMHFFSSMRLHVFYYLFHWVTYLPMAFAVPPATYLVHYQLGIVYQYWLHTEIIDKLPDAIEYVFNTPSHHRAHHGRNRRYIDKNFGAFLIIWDRIFGTFEAENPDDKPLYGVTKQMDSFNPLYIQSRHFIHIWKKFWEYDTIGDKLSVIFKGPGWSPGKPWAGNIEDIPEPVPDIPRYNPKMPPWCKYYTMFHGFMFLHANICFLYAMTLLSKTTVVIIAVYFSFFCVSFGFLTDNSRYGPPVEFLRCIAYFLVDKLIFHEVTKFSTLIQMYFYRTVFSTSLVMWISLYLYSNVKIVFKQKYV